MNSISFVRKLIEGNRYEDYKKDSWGGADVVIVSSSLDAKERQKQQDWAKGNRKLV